MALYRLPATPDTCQWGTFDGRLAPVLTIRSGDLVTMDCITHRAGDAPDYLMTPAIRALYDALWPRKGPGAHIVTGPIAIEEARAGDTLEVRFLAADAPLLYGSNLAAAWGVLYPQAGIPGISAREYLTLYQIHLTAGVAEPVWQADYPYPAGDPRHGGVIPANMTERKPVVPGARVPLRFHLGIAGVAPDTPDPVSTTPPGIFGGNVDNRDFGVGTRMFYPILTDQALFWAGDPHLAEGDGEVSGTAVEGHLQVTLAFVVHKNSFRVRTPVLETGSAWMVHGFHTDLNAALTMAVEEAVHFLADRWRIPMTEAYSLLSTAADFRITQAVNRVKGVHAVIRKDLFQGASHTNAAREHGMPPADLV